MKFNEQSLKSELVDGLLEYERDSNISPFSLVESLIEKFLFKKGYLSYGAGDNEVSFPSELNKPPIPYTTLNRNGKYLVRKTINGVRYHFGFCDYGDAKIIVEFLEKKNWDLKYATQYSEYKGKTHINFLLNEIKKEKTNANK